MGAIPRETDMIYVILSLNSIKVLGRELVLDLVIYLYFRPKISITNIKKFLIQLRLLESSEQNLTPLPYPATQSLLTPPLKPQFYTSP